MKVIVVIDVSDTDDVIHWDSLKREILDDLAGWQVVDIQKED